MGTYGILLPCDGTEPLPVSVGDHLHIADMVGGHFDVVTFDYNANALGALDAPRDAQEFVAVGYLNDTGLVDGLPMNAMGSIMFGRDLYGPIVVVSGTSPNGEYDGDNHDIPTWFGNAVFNGGLHGAAQLLDKHAKANLVALALAFEDGVFTDYEQVRIMEMIDSNDPDYDDSIALIFSVAVTYAMGRSNGSISKFDREGYEQFKFERGESLVTDEEIENFFNEMGGDI